MWLVLPKSSATATFFLPTKISFYEQIIKIAGLIDGKNQVACLLLRSGLRRQKIFFK